MANEEEVKIDDIATEEEAKNNETEEVKAEAAETQEEAKPAKTPQEREEELKRLLVSTDFKDDTYAELALQELIILKNSAQQTKIHTEEKYKDFFDKREEFFLHLILKKLPTIETLYCVFSKYTRTPYIELDEESMNDRIWLYSNERFAQAAVLKMKNDKVELVPVKIDNKDFLRFFTSLFSMSVNEIVLDRGFNPMPFELRKLVREPDFSQLPENQRPISNPELYLTAIYFTQELALPEEVRNKEKLKELEEEMLVNISRGKLIIPVIPPEGVEKPELKDCRIPFLKLPNGDAYQPVCTDPTEFVRFNKNNGMRMIVVDGGKMVHAISKEVKGIMLNPDTLKIAIPKQKF